MLGMVHRHTPDMPDTHYVCDFQNSKQIRRLIQSLQPQYVIHLVAISFVAHSPLQDFYQINALGTQWLLEALSMLPTLPQKILLASSATVYGNQPVSLLHEALCPSPVNHYGVSKLAMEHIAHNQFSDLPIILARPFNYTGIGQPSHFLIPKIVQHYQQKQSSITLGNLHVEREFNDIELILHAYQRLLESPHQQEVVNIASNRGIKLLEVIEMMNQIAGYTIQVKTDPQFIRPNEIPKLTGDPAKLHQLVGKITQKPIHQTLTEMYQSIPIY